MLKRGLAVLITILLLLSSILCVNAEDTAISDVDVSNLTSSEIPEYNNYISGKSDLFGKGDNIVLEAKEYVDSKDAQLSTAEGLKWTGGTGSVTWNFDVSDSGVYNFALEYKPMGDGTEPIEVTLFLDGKVPFAESQSLFFPRVWENDGNIRTDDLGNEFAPKVKQVDGWTICSAFDASGFVDDDLAFFLEQGSHKITLQLQSQDIEIKTISLNPVSDIPTYDEYIKSNKYSSYSGEVIPIEGENAIVRSKKSIVPLSDNSSASVEPHNAHISKINYIGSNNWSRPGDYITWEVDVPESGYYTLNFNYRQNTTINEVFYRTLKIDGKIPFAEAKSIKFKYSGSWDYSSFEDEKGEPYKIYLEKGKRVITLTVTMGPLSDICGELNSLVYDLAGFYRSIVMITGENPDANRDYNLFTQIENYEQRLNDYATKLNNILDKLYKITGSNSGSAASTLRNMLDVIERMRDNKYYAHQYKNRFYSNYSALSAWVYERSEMPIDIDAIFLSSPESSFNGRNNGFFDSLLFGAQKFLYSFVDDYNTQSDSKETLELWINWGRDQAKVLKNLISNDFTEQTGIKVNVKLTNASLLQGILSGNGPDCALQVARSEPLNLAMRGGLYDLSSFDDFDEVMKRFMPTAGVPYQYKGGSYGLPNTQTFYMLFYRKDIFNEMGLSVPQTWDEFLNTSNLLLRKNMQVGLPYTQITDMNQVNNGVGALNIFPTLLMQKNLSIYNKELTQSTLLEADTIDTFVYWTNFYNKFGFPKSYDFYNRFRIGLMPMAVVNYAQYATISAAAPEISRLWAMAPIPGFKQEDGTINRSASGGGTAAVILKDSDKVDKAWELLKWWTSTETQFSYASEIENVLGTAARHDSANIEALKKLSWGKENLSALMEQWAWVKEINEIPGSYYLARVVDQVFWNTTNGQDPYEMMAEWGKVANDEIERKCKQYGN